MRYKTVKRSTFDRNVKTGAWLVVYQVEHGALIEEQRPNRSGCAGVRHHIEFTNAAQDAAMAAQRKKWSM